MKTKRTFLSILTLCIALLFTACSGKEAASTEKSQDTKTESSSVSTDDSNSKLDNLYQQENQIFAWWVKVLQIQMEIMRIIWLTLLNQTKTLLQMTSWNCLPLILKLSEKSRNRSLRLKRKIQDLITPIRKTVPMTHLLSRIFLVRIMMGILLMKACFPKMP